MLGYLPKFGSNHRARQVCLTSLIVPTAEGPSLGVEQFELLRLVFYLFVVLPFANVLQPPLTFCLFNKKITQRVEIGIDF